MKILLVEDDEYISRAIMARLKVQKGLDVTSVYDGVNALKKMKSGKYDLILLDIILPGLNGLDVLEKARSCGVDADVFITTNLSGIEHKVRAKNLGILHFFEKASVSLGELVTKIELYATSKI